MPMKRIAAAIPSLLIDASGIAGVCLVSYGSWLVYAPAGFIVGGMLLIVAALTLGRGSQGGEA